MADTGKGGVPDAQTQTKLPSASARARPGPSPLPVPTQLELFVTAYGVVKTEEGWAAVKYAIPATSPYETVHQPEPYPGVAYQYAALEIETECARLSSGLGVK